MRSGMEPVVKSTVKKLGNGWNPGLQAKPFLVLVLGRSSVLVLGQTISWHPVQRTEVAGAGDPGKVLLDIYPMKSYI